MKNQKVVFYIIGFILVFLAAIMLIPVLVEKVIGSGDDNGFVISSVITSFCGVFLILSNKPSSLQLDHRQTFLLTTLSWLTIVAFAALPFVFSKEHFSYTDAFFETMSGFTTTGSTIIANIDSMSISILVWRDIIMWVGGAGIILLAVAIMPFLRIGGMQLFHTESSERSSDILPTPGQVAFSTLKIYITLTVISTLALFVSGLSFFDSMSHAMSALSTGGFSTHSSSFGHFKNNTTAVWIITVSMLAGSIPLLAYRHLVIGHFKSFFFDPQVKLYIVYLTILSLIVALWLWSHQIASFQDALRLSTFQVVSIASTTGMTLTNYDVWGPFIAMIFFIITFVGGCTGSTSGGLKIFRFKILASVTRLQFRRMLFPRSVQTLHYGERILSIDIIHSVIIFVFIYILTAAIMSLLVCMTGLDILTSLSAVVQALSNVGPGVGKVVGPCCTFKNIPSTTKWLLAACMLLGRVELLTVMILFTKEYWKN